MAASLQTSIYLTGVHCLTAYKKKVLAERAKLKVKLGKGGKGTDNDEQKNNNKLAQLKKQNSKYKRVIKALKRSQPQDDDEGRDAAETEDAGDIFGGKNSKKKNLVEEMTTRLLVVCNVVDL